MSFFHLTPIVTLLLTLSRAEELTVRNNCDHDIFVKGEGFNSEAFNLTSTEQTTVSVDVGPSARLWAHARCDENGENCDTAEGYVSVAEVRWDEDGVTWYDISQVDGYNLPIQMVPYNTGVGGNCHPAGCEFNIDADCPSDNKILKDDRAVACSNPNRDDSTTDYAKAIKASCPKVYSWSGDNADGMRDCQPGNSGVNIVFC